MKDISDTIISTPVAAPAASPSPEKYSRRISFAPDSILGAAMRRKSIISEQANPVLVHEPPRSETATKSQPKPARRASASLRSSLLLDLTEDLHVGEEKESLLPEEDDLISRPSVQNKAKVYR
jgi:hypothetical protein